jgi:chemotaxis protein MotB
MALARIGNARRVENFTWPGFVDALATLLMVIIFVLMVFVLIQVNLAYRVSGQDATLGEMRQQLASLGELLNIERRASADLATNLAQITNQLNASNANRDELQAQLSSLQTAIAARNSQIANLTAKQADTEAALAAARNSLEERLGALQLAEGQLAMAQAQNQSAANRIDALSAETTASKAEIAQMTGALAALRLRIEQCLGKPCSGVTTLSVGIFWTVA